MAFLVSPGVNVTEYDLTTRVPVLSTTDGALVGGFRWGPLNKVELIGSEDELLKKFGKPDSNTYIYFFTAANFLAYGNKLRLVRVTDESTAKNATSEATTGSGTAGTGLLIKNDEHYDENYAGGAGNVGLWAAKYPGALGNSLKVSFCTAASFSQALTGVSTTGTAMTGTGFTTSLTVGSVIRAASGEERTVTAIGGATAATLSAAFTVDLSSAAVTALWEYNQNFGIAPGTSNYASARSSVNDEIHLIVIDEDGVFTGIAGTVLEKFSFLSLAGDAKNDDGTTNYYVEAINTRSKYIRWMDHLPAGTNWGSAAASITYTSVAKPATYSLAGGVDGNSTIDDADKILGYDKFKNAEEIDVALIMGANASSTVATHIINNICEYRKDCVALLSPEFADVVNNAGDEVDDVIAFRDALPSSSYAFLDCNWKYQFDKHNAVYRWLPLNGDVAGLCVATDQSRDPWWSPAGFNRGNIKNCIKLAWNPYQAERDDLYLKGVNPVVSFPGQGVILYGDKTLLNKPSAFDRLNVRRLFIVLEKSIATAAKFSLFEFNDAFTRASFRNLVEPYLRDVKGRRGIYDYYVVCDETNNTPEVIDRNEFVGDIYIKPARSISFIQLNFVAVSTGVAFTEVVGQF